MLSSSNVLEIDSGIPLEHDSLRWLHCALPPTVLLYQSPARPLRQNPSSQVVATRPVVLNEIAGLSIVVAAPVVTQVWRRVSSGLANSPAYPTVLTSHFFVDLTMDPFSQRFWSDNTAHFASLSSSKRGSRYVAMRRVNGYVRRRQKIDQTFHLQAIAMSFSTSKPSYPKYATCNILGDASVLQPNQKTYPKQHVYANADVTPKRSNIQVLGRLVEFSLGRYRGRVGRNSQIIRGARRNPDRLQVE